MLGIVGLEEASEVASAQSAMALNVDVLMAGTPPAGVMSIIARVAIAI
ncbi:hypothetical protein GCM10007874_32640 [Labrys miyagiensis]|uniref:Uncharacterized protein n=1 Tax=Labrys miyagiensis TaxID=346912 RepID=A0ABQ6CPV2_9HYPH|nr:hypothetical protein GCM10007874_32640 [Labrys miyagiensis]